MTLTNPFSSDGSFSAAEKLAALEREVLRSRAYHQGLVDAGRMKRENFASKIGALEAVVADLRAAMVLDTHTRGGLKPFDRVKGTVRIRTNLGFEIKEDSLPLNGQEIVFAVGWQLEHDHRRYPGEWTLMPEEKPAEGTVYGWIASGDVEGLRPA